MTVHQKMEMQSLSFFSPQNTTGVLRENCTAVISQTIEANGDKLSNVNKNTR